MNSALIVEIVLVNIMRKSIFVAVLSRENIVIAPQMIFFDKSHILVFDLFLLVELISFVIFW